MDLSGPGIHVKLKERKKDDTTSHCLHGNSIPNIGRHSFWLGLE
jgi:hypothetical protein